MTNRTLGGTIAVVTVLALGACAAPGTPAVLTDSGGTSSPTPTATADDSGSGSAEPVVCSLGPLPGTALVRMCGIAVAPGGTRLQVVLTVDEPTSIAGANAADRTALESRCVNTIADAGWNTPGTTRLAEDFGGFITATLDVQGVDWPAPSVLYTGFGANIQWGESPSVTSPDDSASFGCFQPVTFAAAGTTHLIGAIDAADYNGGIDGWIRSASFGFGEAYPASTGVVVDDCTVELSAHAAALDDLWLPPEAWGSGCVVGAQGSEHD